MGLYNMQDDRVFLHTLNILFPKMDLSISITNK